ncbi:DUF3237 domain-containing protein [Streptomyces sp. NBC_00878]|uniref:DUF3237 domain-containing protein n=1 Tax=Streptomyces sp. NBC_00878 TaxID=2975854 RepID=UPI00225B51DD|nr:DUF3237 domain-containing protein [Streptomyces sp. NBC_00878]MCX4909022.1 DUF3237 domain-containing protein [Streptomyces sp. NBC_00878]
MNDTERHTDPLPTLSLPLPTLEPLAIVTVDLGPVIELGETPSGRRRIVPIAGGNLQGPALAGRVLPGGADWQTVLDNGTALIEARYTLQLTDGALVALSAQGVRTGRPHVLAALARGEDVDPRDYYFRFTVAAETSSEEYAWLGRSVLLATGARGPEHVTYDLYRAT